MVKATSKNAVTTQSQKKLLADRAKIKAVLKRNPKSGCTRGEISEKTGIALQTVCWRISDMKATKQVYISGKKIYSSASELPCEAIYWNFQKEEKAA